jgi:hypothetical protein
MTAADDVVFLLDPHTACSSCAPADLAIGRIGDLLNCDFSALSRPATAADGKQETT